MSELKIKHNSYSIELKLKIIKYAKEKGIHDAKRHYEILRKCIREWIKQKNSSVRGRCLNVCLRYSDYIREKVNVANTYQENSLCFMLSIVSGKSRHINEMAKNRR